MEKAKKIVKGLLDECRQRGAYYFFIMYLTNSIAIFRALIYKMLYFRNIKGGLYFLGARSRMDVYCKKSKITINPFVFIRKNVTIRVDFDSELVLGEKVFINDNCNINCVRRISIGSYTKIGQNVCIYDHDHNYRKETTDRLLTGEVVIGSNVWIGSNVVILRNTHIGDNAVIAAGSIVKGDVPPNSVFLNKRQREIIPYE
ncbi:acyltransferase [Clostridium thermosuccinogenes]|nr:acyltransferase [Pseudoclostridium thermosuccinogenes]